MSQVAIEGQYETDVADLHSRIVAAEDIKDWSKILADSISWGNKKVSDTTAIVNMNSAHNCPNRETQEEGESETGICQVSWKMCYARKVEERYETVRNYRDRQEYLWDCLDPDTFAKAFLKVVDRKIQYGNLESYSDVDLRFSESGDFRHDQDVYKVDRIADILHDAGVSAVYSYSGSYKLDSWFEADNVILMQSVSREVAGEYGHKEYNAFPISREQIEEAERITDIAPDGYVWCPHDLEKRQKDIVGEEAISCGECRLCLDKEGPDVAIPIS